MNRTLSIPIILLLAVLATAIPAQQHTENKADQTLRGPARINPATLGVELEIPLANYSGRGIDVPVSISYSSKVWRLDYAGSQPAVNNPDNCISLNNARFADNSAGGWTSSLSTPYIEYVGADNIYNSGGAPAGSDNPGCTPNTPPQYNANAWVKRIAIHLPSGETHEMRMDDAILTFDPSSLCGDGDPRTACDPNDPALPGHWNGWYYATDGSNIRYFEDRSNNVYFAQLPDGSRYEFGPAIVGDGSSTKRKAVRYSDVNGNSTTYHEPAAGYPNGYWVDTIGRVIPIPLTPRVPADPSVESVGLPGFGGSSIWFRFHWKRLKGATPEESALSDFNAELRFIGDKYLQNGTWQTRAAGRSLFGSDFDSWVIARNEPFNPVVLAAVELAGGQTYRFCYNVFGEVERITMPSGGEERVTFDKVASISDLQGPNADVNRGAVRREVYESPSSSAPYIWTFDARASGPNAFVVSTVNPDGTRNERLMHRGLAAGSLDGSFGFENALAGTVFEERLISSSNRIVTRQFTNWARSLLPRTVNGNPAGFADWHPRIQSVETVTYDANGNGVSATTVSAYDDPAGLNQRSTPVLKRSVAEYGYVAAGNPLPANPIRTTENTYLISDPSIAQSVRDSYRNRNLVAPITAVEIRDGAGMTVRRTETVFDEPTGSPGQPRGLATTVRNWDDSKGAASNPDAYVANRTRYDSYGNVIELVDANGNPTRMEFDPSYQAFPARTVQPAPDPTGEKGSAQPLVSESAFDASSGLQTLARDPNGVETRFEYDPASLRLTAKRSFQNNSPTGHESETEYVDAPGGSLVRTKNRVNASEWSVETVYLDGLAREFRTERADPKGNILTDTEFDAAGRVQRRSEPYRAGDTRAWTVHVYDEASRLIRLVLPDGSVITTDWGVLISDLVGTSKTITDQAGKKRRGILDALGRVVRVVEDPGGLNLTSDYVFDAAGNIRKTVQGEQTRFFAFDSLGRLTHSKIPEQDANPVLVFTDPLSGNSQWSSRYEYDSAGNILRSTDARGITLSATYDRLHRQTRRDYSDATPDVDFYFDGAGLGAPAVNSIGRQTRVSTGVSDSRSTAFDAFGRVARSEQRTDGRIFVSEYEYDLAGNLIAEKYPSGRTVSYRSDVNGRLESVSENRVDGTVRPFLTNAEHNAAGAQTRARLGSGKWESAAFNSRQQIVSVGLGYSAGDRNLLALDFDYGPATENNGSMRSQTIAFRGISGPVTQHYAYDPLNRLASAAESAGGSQTWRQAFEYDRFGNRRFKAETTTLGQTIAPKISNPIVTASSNRLAQDQDQDGINDYNFDPAGNLILDAANRRFVFDAENRLKEFFAPGNPTPSPDQSYRFDGSGKRVMKISSAEKTIFVYNAFGKLVAEYSTTVSVTPKTAFLTSDHLGSPRVVTNGSGFVVARHDYLPFGDELSETVGNTGGRSTAQGYGREDGIRQGFTGYERDDESGLDFAQARSYNAALGRFTSVDPLNASMDVRDPQSFNRYSYALNSPYKFVDPLGLLADSTGAHGQSDRPRRKPQPKPKKPKNEGLKPNPNVVVPENVRRAARNSTIEGTSTTTGQTVRVIPPASMVQLQTDLANYTYTHTGAAVSQEISNSIYGSVSPQQVTVSQSQSQTREQSEGSTTSGSAEISQEPNVSLSAESTSSSSRSATTNSQASVTGRSTDTRGIQNEIANQTNLAITNWVNQNADANGNIPVTIVDRNNTQSRGVISRDTATNYLKSFVSRVRAQAYHDFGGR